LVIVENNFFCSVIICRQSRYYVVLANVTVMLCPLITTSRLGSKCIEVLILSQSVIQQCIAGVWFVELKIRVVLGTHVTLKVLLYFLLFKCMYYYLSL